MPDKAAVITMLETVQADVEDWVAQLPSEERASSGDYKRWSGQDLLAHMAFWSARIVARLDAEARGEEQSAATEFDEEFEGVNIRIYDEYRDHTWEQVLAFWRGTQDGLIAALQPLTDADMNDAQRFDWLEGRPLWRRIAGTAGEHVLLHLATYAIERGNLDHALAMQQRSVELLAPLDLDPDWQGTLTYNLACFLALTGNKDEAIARLDEALRLNPHLIEWSKQDSDLDSLRADPAFRAIYGEV